VKRSSERFTRFTATTGQTAHARVAVIAPTSRNTAISADLRHLIRNKPSNAVYTQRSWTDLLKTSISLAQLPAFPYAGGTSLERVHHHIFTLSMSKPVHAGISFQQYILLRFCQCQPNRMADRPTMMLRKCLLQIGRPFYICSCLA
jgi:hypothetical protein